MPNDFLQGFQVGSSAMSDRLNRDLRYQELKSQDALRRVQERAAVQEMEMQLQQRTQQIQYQAEMAQGLQAASMMSSPVVMTPMGPIPNPNPITEEQAIMRNVLPVIGKYQPDKVVPLMENMALRRVQMEREKRLTDQIGVARPRTLEQIEADKALTAQRTASAKLSEARMDEIKGAFGKMSNEEKIAFGKQLGLEPSTLDAKGQVSMARPTGGEAGTLSGIGKEEADLAALEKSGDPERVKRFKLLQAQRNASKNEVVRVNPSTGDVEIIKGEAASSLPAGVITKAEDVANQAANIVNFGQEVIRLSAMGTTGLRGNLNRLAVEWGPQFGIDAEAGEEFDFAMAAALFKSKATAILKSDSQISEPERKLITKDLPSSGYSESDKSAKRKAQVAMKQVAESARRQVLRAGRPLPPELMTPTEIVNAQRAGKLTKDEAIRALKVTPMAE